MVLLFMMLLIIKNLIIGYCLSSLIISYIILNERILGYLCIIIFLEGIYMLNKDFKFLLNMYNKKKF
jgi:hypothetical protein